jgi:hypothetical protein
VPLYAWYRALDARGGRPPERAANQLPSPAFTRILFLLWTPGVPLLVWGLGTGQVVAIRWASVVLACGVATGMAYLRYLLRTAKSASTHS